MDFSDFTPWAAVAIAALAVALGEWRAWKERRSRGERNIVDWSVSWPSAGGFTVMNNGPDEAKHVLTEIWVEYEKGEATSRRVQRNQSLVVTMPHLSDLWAATVWKDPRRGASGHVVNVVDYRIRVTWKTPNGARQVWENASSIQTFVDITIADLFVERPAS